MQHPACIESRVPRLGNLCHLPLVYAHILLSRYSVTELPFEHRRRCIFGGTLYLEMVGAFTQKPAVDRPSLRELRVTSPQRSRNVICDVLQLTAELQSQTAHLANRRLHKTAGFTEPPCPLNTLLAYVHGIVTGARRLSR